MGLWGPSAGRGAHTRAHTVWARGRAGGRGLGRGRGTDAASGEERQASSRREHRPHSPAGRNSLPCLGVHSGPNGPGRPGRALHKMRADAPWSAVWCGVVTPRGFRPLPSAVSLDRGAQPAAAPSRPLPSRPRGRGNRAAQRASLPSASSLGGRGEPVWLKDTKCPFIGNINSERG